MEQAEDLSPARSPDAGKLIAWDNLEVIGATGYVVLVRVKSNGHLAKLHTNVFQDYLAHRIASEKGQEKADYEGARLVIGNLPQLFQV